MTRPTGLQWFLLLGLLAPGCGEPASAIRLVLTPNPELNLPEDVARQVARVRIVIDSADGLAGVARAGATPGGGEAIDWDEDGSLEVVFDVATPEEASFPTLEIALDTNLDRELFLRVLGFPEQGELSEANAIARGAGSAATARGEIEQLGVPFNLQPWARPPRVVLVHPTDGQEWKVGGTTPTIFVALSTTIESSSLDGTISLTSDSAGNVPCVVEVQDHPCAESSVHGACSMLQLEPGLMAVGQHTLQVGPGVLSTTQLELDQDPGTAVVEPFRSTFDVRLPDAVVEQPCQLGCVRDAQAECVPPTGCAPGFVPIAECTGFSLACIEDCRVGACRDPGSQCDHESGWCG